MTRLTLPFLLLALGLAACDSGEPAPAIAPGSFRASLTLDGDRLDLSGFAAARNTAFFAFDSVFTSPDSIDTEGEPAFLLTLVNPGASGGLTRQTISIVLPGEDAPAPGRYDLGGEAMASLSGFGDLRFSGETGTLTVDASSPTRTTGSFVIQASYTAALSQAGGTAVVEGRFHALQVRSPFDGDYTPLP